LQFSNKPKKNKKNHRSRWERRNGVSGRSYTAGAIKNFMIYACHLGSNTEEITIFSAYNYERKMQNVV
jgi:hypothetical protein